MKILSKIFDVVCFVLGPMCLTAVFNFSGTGLGVEGAVRYYYTNEARLGILIGTILVCIGFLRKHWKKESK